MLFVRFIAMKTNVEKSDQVSVKSHSLLTMSILGACLFCQPQAQDLELFMHFMSGLSCVGSFRYICFIFIDLFRCGLFSVSFTSWFFLFFFCPSDIPKIYFNLSFVCSVLFQLL